jgi:hypothetical protein
VKVNAQKIRDELAAAAKAKAAPKGKGNKK